MPRFFLYQRLMDHPHYRPPFHYAPRSTKKRACKKRRKSSLGLLKLLFLTITYVNIVLQGGNLRMSFLETRLQGYIITGTILISLSTYEDLKLSRNSCEYKLNSYTHAGNRKPWYFGYATYDEAKVAWEFFLKTHVIPFSPLDGGVSATPFPPAQPMTPQHNRHPNVQVQPMTPQCNRYPNIQGRPFSYTHSLPTPAQHGGSLASSPARSMITSPPHSPSIQQTTTETMFFVVVVGYNPGVFSSQ